MATRKKKKPAPRKKPKSDVDALLAETPEATTPKEFRRNVRRVLQTKKNLDDEATFTLKLLIAESYWGEGQLRRCQREYLRLAESSRRHPLTLLRLALIAELFGEADIAQQHYEQAISIANKNQRTETRVAFARFLRRHGEYRESARLLKLAAKGEKKNGPAAAERAYVEALAHGHDPTFLKGWRRRLQRLAGDDPLFSYFLGNLDLWDGRPMEGVRRLRAFVARMETAPASLSNTLYFETEHARRVLVRIEASQSVQMP